MTGTIYNTAAILIGSLTGSLFRKNIGEKQQKVMFDAMGLAAAGIGINSIVNNMPDSRYPVLFIVSLAAGSLLGSWLDIDGKFQKLVSRTGNEGLGQGLSTAILLFCIGTLSILGPIQSALNDDHTYLFTMVRWIWSLPWYWHPPMVLASHWQLLSCFSGRAASTSAQDLQKDS